MKKALSILIVMVVSAFSMSVDAASNSCTYQATVGPFTPTKNIYYAQLINQQNNQVLATIGPLGPNGSNYVNIKNCPTANVYAVYTDQSNGGKNMSNSVFLAGNGHYLYSNLAANGGATLKVEF